MKLGDRVAPYRGTRFTEGLLYLRRRRLKVRIHGRPRSDRKRRFLLSAVAPSTSTRHPREAKPINWAQRGGLASGPGNCVLTPRPHFTAPSCTLGNQVVGASDGPPFRQERRPTRVCRSPGSSDMFAALLFADGAQGGQNVADLGAGGVVGVHVDPANQPGCVDDDDGGHGQPVAAVSVV